MPSSHSETQTTLTITVPIPPMELSKNGRAHWMERNRLFQEHKMAARNEINRQLWSGHTPHSGPVMIYAGWYAAKRPYPDFGNAVNRLEAYVDAAEEADLILNDRQVRQTQVDFDTDASDPRVVLTFVLEGTD